MEKEIEKLEEIISASWSTASDNLRPVWSAMHNLVMLLHALSAKKSAKS